MPLSIQSLSQVQMDRRAILYALGSVAAIAVVLKRALFRGPRSPATSPAVCCPA